jgi:hypothetical protein
LSHADAQRETGSWALLAILFSLLVFGAVRPATTT